MLGAEELVVYFQAVGTLGRFSDTIPRLKTTMVVESLWKQITSILTCHLSSEDPQFVGPKDTKSVLPGNLPAAVSERRTG